ncbi:DsbA family oxidoreductase [Wukongibacter sp. M2B1]|uniref:DsbA family oxidoreductase n=1 Tax=Wukongibacter sp. M2B1 TaxID=3088895 RepID=UPI003D79F45D
MEFIIKIFSDYICPFCYIGLGIVNELKKDYKIKEEWVGFEIHPETPSQGVSLVERFGAEDFKVNMQRLERSGKKYGIEFGRLRSMPNSHNALEAAEYARSVGKFDEYHKALMDAYFRDSKNIGDIKVLLEIGKHIGLDPLELSNTIKTHRFEHLLEYNRFLGKDLGIKSTPTFVINAEYAIVGPQPIEVFRNLFDEIKIKRN